ncbi:MAG TPA: hypothetical protein VGL25_18585 [Casimicrobiaceae bacterium]|jgi:hypothetical protein
MQINFAVPAMLAITIASAGIALAGTETVGFRGRADVRLPALIAVGHDNIDVDPALRRYTGIVVALGSPDDEGRIYSFQAKPIGPRSSVPASNELRGWRLTVLAGQRFASVFEVKRNTESQIEVAARDGPLNGLAVSDVFIVEEIAAAPPPAQQAAPQTGT